LPPIAAFWLKSASGIYAMNAAIRRPSRQAQHATLRWEWWAPVGLLLATCFYVACCAWRDGRRMAAFMAQMPDALLSQNAAIGGKASQS
jgi:hypothetical protein